jgi:hypothetical protein
MSVISMEEIADKRWRNMLIMCDYTAFGTLWCVSENVWKTTLLWLSHDPSTTYAYSYEDCLPSISLLGKFKPD